MIKIILRFGLLSATLLILFQLSKYAFFYSSIGKESMIALLGIAFIGVGIYLSQYFRKEPAQKTDFKEESGNSVEPKVDFGISDREMEVLQAIERGLSNREIAKALFISETTVKSHVSNLLRKLDAKRRTEAVAIAKSHHLI